MSTIVLVHGIAQEQYAADVLETRWVPALAGGVRTAGSSDLADRLWRGRDGPGGIDSRMAFYGDLFLRRGQQGLEPDLADLSTEAAALARALAVEWLERARDRGSRLDQRREAAIELAALRPDPALAEQGVRALLRTPLQGLARLRWFACVGMGVAERFVVRALAQVSRYLTDDAIRTAVQRRVRDHIGLETRVVVAHSLGSVVAYEVVHGLPHPLPLLVTLGSPLGLNTIVYDRLRPQPPSYPRPVRRWVNVADLDDLVAAAPDLTGRFSADMPADALFESRATVDNGSEPHSATYYLAKSEVGRPIAEALV